MLDFLFLLQIRTSRAFPYRFRPSRRFSDRKRTHNSTFPLFAVSPKLSLLSTGNSTHLDGNTMKRTELAKERPRGHAIKRKSTWPTRLRLTVIITLFLVCRLRRLVTIRETRSARGPLYERAANPVPSCERCPLCERAANSVPRRGLCPRQSGVRRQLQWEDRFHGQNDYLTSSIRAENQW